MTALVSGGSGGIGFEIAKQLAFCGYNLILVSRGAEKLNKAKNEILKNVNNKINVEVLALDLSCEESCFELFETVRDKNIDILINNAGFGAFGAFDKTDIKTDINMIDLNIKSVLILTKLFLNYFKEKNSGYIMNVASAAAFAPGPMLANYYATKSYVLRLTHAVYEELRRDKSGVRVCALCPGPVKTGFNDRAGVKFDIHPMEADAVAKYAVKKMFKGALTIIPGFFMKTSVFMSKIAPLKLCLRIVYNFQKRKIN